jgi:preprotein translocase subunit SecE
VPSGAVSAWYLQREYALTTNTLPSPSTGSTDIVKYALAVLLVVAGLTGYYYFEGQWPGVVRALAVVAAIVLAAFVCKGTAKGSQAIGFLAESRFELRKVVWPTRQEATKTMWVVVVAVIAISLILAAFDWIIQLSVKALLGS